MHNAQCFRSIVAQHSFRLKLCSVKCIVQWYGFNLGQQLCLIMIYYVWEPLVTILCTHWLDGTVFPRDCAALSCMHLNLVEEAQIKIY